MAAGDVDGGGKPEIIVGEGNRILVYPGDGSEWKVKYSFEGRATGMKVASLDTADLDKDGKDEIFVTVNNTFLNRLETYVLKWENGSLVQVATLPWMSRAYEDESGARRIASQQLLDDPNFPLGAIYPLEYRDGKYVQAGPPLRLSRLEWIYSFALAQEPETKQLLHVSYSTTSRIRAQFLKKPWLSPDAYGQTSSRVRWHDKPFMFGPRLILDRAPGKLYLYALQNVPAFGMLANAFGYYSSSRLQKLDWSGASFDPEWTVEIPAYTADIAVVRTFSSEEIYAAVVTGGKTSIWKFVP